MKKVFNFLFLLVLVSGSSLIAGTWENYSNITAITDVQPIGDNVWVTCKGGVISYNQLTGEKVIYQKGDVGLPSAAVEQIDVDPGSNVIWVGTYDAGVVEWDGGNWITYPFPEPFNLYRMKFDGLSNLWIQANTGLFKFDISTHEYTFINSVGGAGWDFNAWYFDITPDNHVLIFTGTNCLVIDAATNTPIDSFPNSEDPFLLACSPLNVRLYGVDENTYLIDNFGQLQFEFKDGTYEPAMTGLPDFAFITNITRGEDNNIYAFVNGTDIYRLNGLVWEVVKSFAAGSYDKLLFADSDLFYINEYSWYQSPDLIRMTDMTIDVLDMQQFAFTSNNVQGITMDDAGNVLMVSGSKIYSYNAIDNAWDHFTDVPAIYGSMYDLKFVNGNLYGVDYGNMLEYFDGSTWTHIPVADGYESIYIFDYDVSADGVVYFVNDEGLFRSEGGVTENLIEAYDIDEWFLSVAYDASRDLVWLGRINGIIKYDFENEELINSVDVPEMAGATSIQEIKLDALNNVWFGANNNSAYKFDGAEWEAFTMGDSDDFIIEIAFSGTKTYFGLTGGTGGMYMYDQVTEVWTYYNTTEDVTMASNSVNQMVIDLNEDIWIAHADAGVSVYRTVEEPVTVNEIVAENELLLFPNPAVSSISILTDVSVNDFYTIIDLQGRELLSGSMINNSINISNLPNGIYFLSMYNDLTGSSAVSEFTIQK